MPEQSPNRVKILWGEANTRISGVQQGYLDQSPYAVAMLAKLRQADAVKPSLAPELWGLTLGGLPDELTGNYDQPTRAELALHSSMVLYATHQQSHQNSPMHRTKKSLGSAVRDLAYARGGGSEMNEGVITRFHQLSVANTHRMRVHVLRSLITMLRGEEIGMDYAQLACDLYLLQNPMNRETVLLRWGRDLNRRASQQNENQEITNS